MHRSALWLAAAALTAWHPPSESIQRVTVLDSFLSYREVGTGSPMVFLHGNPTSSHVWRHVLPLVAEKGRCLAPDRVRGVVVFETILQVRSVLEFAAPARGLTEVLKGVA